MSSRILDWAVGRNPESASHAKQSSGPGGGSVADASVIRHGSRRGRIELLAAKYGAEIQSYCYLHLADVDSAYEAVQHVLCKALLNSDQSIDNERAWLYAIARNHCLNVIRQRLRHNRAMTGRAQLREFQSQATSILSEIVRRETDERLSEIVLALPLDLRVPLYLRYFAGFSRGEIVDLLGVSEHVVKSRLYRALKQLREHSSLKMT